jgi:hypothetical protein
MSRLVGSVANRRCRARAAQWVAFALRLVRGFAGVLFDQSRPPSLRQLGEVTFTDRRVGQAIRVSVRTGRDIGSHERLELQITAICRR